MKYKEVRNQMKPGDLLAFGGDGVISNIIKVTTNSPVSHVGVILQSNIPTLDGYFINQVIESTSLEDGFAGVKINRVSDHIRDYDGSIWWYPMNKEFDQGVFFSFLLDQVGKPYDAPQAILSAIDFVPDSKEDLDKLFCSELIAAAYEQVGIIGEINASEQTPVDVCNMDIFDNPISLRSYNNG